MKKRRILSMIILCLIILLALLFIFLILTLNREKKEVNNTVATIVTVNKNTKTVKEIIEKHDSEYIGKKSYIVYVDFLKDLFEENGDSNEEYFENLIRELCELEEFEEKAFYLIDNEKNIKITVHYNREKKVHEIFYNNIENFYNQTDGEAYLVESKSEILKEGRLTLTADELTKLTRGNMFLKTIKSGLGEGTPLGEKYTSYKNGSLILEIIDSRVINIIFTEKYEEDVFDDVKVGTSLEKIFERFPNITAGGVEEDYILYRTDYIYAFCYEDEISVYGYNYYENPDFEKYVEEYLNDGDLDSFVKKVTKQWINYDIFEYNPDIKTVHIRYPSRGIDINIKENNPKGITLYSNYNFSDKAISLIKNGKISFNGDDDLLVLREEERRKNF